MFQSRFPVLALALAAGAHGAVKVSLHLPEPPFRGGQVYTLQALVTGPVQSQSCRWDSKRGDLYVTDGHAVRRIRLNQDRTRGQVETLIGQVDRAAPPQDFRAFVAGADLLAPCLNNPQDLAWTGDALAILDTYQHVVRHFDPEQGNLVALAGDSKSVDPEASTSEPQWHD